MSAAVLGALAGGLLSTFSSQNAQDDMQKYNERMYQQYLSPSAQAINLRGAGINPAFALSQIAAGATQTPQMSSPRDTSGMQALSSSLPTAFLQDEQSRLLREQTENQQIRNSYENVRQMLEVNQMRENVKGLKFDNYVKKNTKDLQVNIIENTNRQMYTKTFVDNLLAVGTSWDVASKAMFAQIGQPLEFEKMRTDIAVTSANLSYQLKVNKWYDKFSKAQIDSLYSNAAAAIIQAHSAERNSFINAYLAPGQNDLNKNQSRNLYENSLSTSWNRRKDKTLFPLVKQSLRLGVQSQGVDIFNKSNHYDQPLWNTAGGAVWDTFQHFGTWYYNGLRTVGAGAAAYSHNVKASTERVKQRQAQKAAYEASQRKKHNKQ